MATKGVVSILLEAKDGASRIISGLSANLKKFQGEAKELLGNKLVQVFSLGAILAGLKSVTDETLKWDQSLRDLAGAARVTGAPLDFIRATAARVREEVSVSKIEANQFAEELVRLAAKAGDLTLVDKNFKAIFDTLAAQGFTGVDALNALQAAVEGNDRVVKKLFNIKPDELYARFAASVGKTADQLTAAEKSQAIFNQFAVTGAKTVGALKDALASTGEKVHDVDEALSDAKIAFGQDLRPAIDLAVQGFTLLIMGASLFVKGVGAIGRLAGAVFFSLTDAVAGAARAIFELAQGNFGAAGAEAEKTAANIKNNFAGAIDGIKQDYADLAADTQKFDKAKFDAANAQIKKDREREGELEKAKLRQKNLENELALIDAKIKAKKEQPEDIQRLADIQQEINKKLEDRTLSYEEQIRLQGILLGIEQTRQELTNRNVGDNEVRGPRGNTVAGDAGLGQHNLGQATGAGLDENGNIKTEGILAGQRPEGIPAAAKEKVATLGQELAAVFVEAAADPLKGFFEKLITGFDSMSDAVKAFGQAVVQALANIAATAVANKIISGLLGSINGGGGIKIPGLAGGGLISGPGGPKDDRILAALSNGEGVLTAQAVAAIGGRAGLDYLNNLNSPTGVRVPRFADGGIAGSAAEGGRFDASLTVGLGDGLVLSELETPSGQRGLMRVIGKNKNALKGVLGVRG